MKVELFRLAVGVYGVRNIYILTTARFPGNIFLFEF